METASANAEATYAHSGHEKMKVIDYCLFYGQNQALKNINMEIAPREVTALIGPSGCGKSSFLRSINRMNDLIPGTRSKGQIIFDGEDICSPRTDVVELRRRIGMVFQRPNPFPMSIFDNVAYGLRIHGVRSKQVVQAKVEEVLRAAAIWDEVKDKLRRSAMDLSGGQQQRLCIARALAIEPEVLLMDEPASALDPISSAKVEELCLELGHKYTIIIVTHNMQQAARISAMTGFFLSGELVEMGKTDKIFTNPEDKRTEDYITGRFG